MAAYDRDVSMLTQVELEVYDHALELIDQSPTKETTSGELAQSTELELEAVLEALQTLGSAHLNLRDAEEMGEGHTRITLDVVSDHRTPSD